MSDYQPQPLAEAYHMQGLQDLEDFIQTIIALEDDPSIQKAFTELPKSVKKKRCSFAELAVDEIADIFVALSYNCNDEGVPYNFYARLKNTLVNENDPFYSEDDARHEVAQKYQAFQQKDTYSLNILPYFLTIILDTQPQAVARGATDQFRNVLWNMGYAFFDETSLSVTTTLGELMPQFEQAVQQWDVSAADDTSQEDAADHKSDYQPPDPDDIEQEVHRQTEKQQKIYVLRTYKERYEQHLAEIVRQLRELGEDVGYSSEIERLADKLAESQMPQKIRERAEEELDRLKDMPKQHAEYHKIVTYLSTVIDFPWGQYDDVNTDLGRARDILEEDHYGLESVKEQVLQQLAVQQRSNNGKPKVICLTGPPGTGKTSVAQSLARATGRKFVKMGLGGNSDETDMRGFSQTYLGAKPGRIVKNLIKAGTQNPLFLLDEIDKLDGNGPNGGNAQAALLEALDPSQNSHFEDRFMETGIDLSDVMFVTTANSICQVSPALRDRMQVIEIEPYITEEKMAIARRHLIDRAKENAGIKATRLTIKDDTLREIITAYAPEPGVRKLQESLDTICSKHAKDIALGHKKERARLTIGRHDLAYYLGPPSVEKRTSVPADSRTRTVNGLAATTQGGTILEINTARKPANGNTFQLKVTAVGQTGTMLKNSAEVAQTYIESHCEELGIREDALKGMNLHVHFIEPGGGVDGPSAGAAMATAILAAAVSEIKNSDVRRDVAMTGTVEPTGKVGRIGRLKQKLDAARNNPDMTTVLIPEDNRSDLQNVPDSIQQSLTIVPVNTMREVLDHALEDPQATLSPSNDDATPGERAAGSVAATLQGKAIAKLGGAHCNAHSLAGAAFHQAGRDARRCKSAPQNDDALTVLRRAQPNAK